MALFLRALGHSAFVEHVGDIGGFGCYLRSASALLVCMPADRKVSARSFLFVFALTSFASHGLND